MAARKPKKPPLPDGMLAEGYSTNVVPMKALHVAGRDKVVLLVSEAPGVDEDRGHEGESFRFVRAAYVDYFRMQDHADVQLTFAVKCRPPSRAPKPNEIKKHLALLESDILALSVQYKEVSVLAMGAVACKALGMKSLSASFKSQGAEVHWGGVPIRFFATLHPAAVLRDQSLGISLESHLACLMRHVSGKAVTVGNTGNAGWLIAPARIEHGGVVCLDIETYGCLAGVNQSQFHPLKAVYWDRVRPRDAIVSCALTFGNGSAYYDLSRAAHRRALCGVLRQVQHDRAVLLLQNATFDLTFLRAFLPASRRYLEPPTVLADLMVSSYLVDEARPEKSLKALAPLLMGSRGLYKDEWRSLNFSGPGDPELPAYNIADTERTYACHQICRESYQRLYSGTTQKGSPYSDQWYSDLLHLVTWMSETGVKIDVPALEQLDRRLAARKDRLEALATAHLGLTLEGKGSDKSKRGAISDALSLVPADVAGRVELTKTGKVPYDDETRNLLLPVLPGSAPRATRRRINVIGRHQNVAKLLSTYTGPILRGRIKSNVTDHSPRSIAGRIYPTWFPVPREFGDSGQSGGTKQGRLAAKSPSVPTFPPIIKALVLVDAWADYSQIELRIAALLSNDPVMMAEYSGVPDLHSRTAKLIFGDDIANHANFKTVYRQAGKVINFLMLYRGGAEKFRESLLRDVGIDFPLEECYAAIERFWATYRGLRVWQDGVIAFVKEHGYYELPLTGQSRLFSRAECPINEVCNFPVQTVAANVTLSAQYRLWNRARLAGVGLTCPINIYDAIGMELRSHEKEKYGFRRAKTIMESVLPNPPYYQDLCAHLGRSLPLAYEVKLG